MALAWLILTAFYIYSPEIVDRMPNELLRVGIYIVITVAILIIGMKLAKTGQLFNKKIPQGKVKILTIIAITILTLQIGLLTLIVKVEIFKLPLIKILKILVAASMAGICEEVLFRGILFNSFLTLIAKNKYKFFLASLIGSMLFGLLHLVNLSHQSLLSIIGQIIFATSLGLALSYIRIVYNGMIWPILIHFWQDFSPVIATPDTGNSDVSLMLSYYVPVAIFMLICIYAYNVRYNKVAYDVMEG